MAESDLEKNAEYSQAFGLNHDEEDPRLVAQRLLNIFRQLHIFTTHKRKEFNDDLLKQPLQVKKALAALPGGSLVLEYLNELEEKAGVKTDISLLKSSKENIQKEIQSVEEGHDEIAQVKILAKALSEAQGHPSNLAPDDVKKISQDLYDKFESLKRELESRIDSVKVISADEKTATLSSDNANIAKAISDAAHNIVQQQDKLSQIKQDFFSKFSDWASSNQNLLQTVASKTNVQKSSKNTADAVAPFSAFDFENFITQITEKQTEMFKEFSKQQADNLSNVLSSVLKENSSASLKVIERALQVFQSENLAAFTPKYHADVNDASESMGEDDNFGHKKNKKNKKKNKKDSLLLDDDQDNGFSASLSSKISSFYDNLKKEKENLSFIDTENAPNTSAQNLNTISKFESSSEFNPPVDSDENKEPDVDERHEWGFISDDDAKINTDTDDITEDSDFSSNEDVLELPSFETDNSNENLSALKPIKEEDTPSISDTSTDFSSKESSQNTNSDGEYVWEYADDDESPQSADSDGEYVWEYTDDDESSQNTDSDGKYVWEYTDDDESSQNADSDGEYVWEYADDDESSQNADGDGEYVWEYADDDESSQNVGSDGEYVWEYADDGKDDVLNNEANDQLSLHPKSEPEQESESGQTQVETLAQTESETIDDSNPAFGTEVQSEVSQQELLSNPKLDDDKIIKISDDMPSSEMFSMLKLSELDDAQSSETSPYPKPQL